jgi:hypothetical protein
MSVNLVNSPFRLMNPAFSTSLSQNKQPAPSPSLNLRNDTFSPHFGNDDNFQKYIRKLLPGQSDPEVLFTSDAMYEQYIQSKSYNNVDPPKHQRELWDAFVSYRLGNNDLTPRKLREIYTPPVNEEKVSLEEVKYQLGRFKNQVKKYLKKLGITAHLDP